MHKVRLTQNNYQLVAESSGQSPEVLMNHYNEALDSEKRALARLVEDSFYPADLHSLAPQNSDLAAILSKLQQNPDMMQQLLQTCCSVRHKHRDAPSNIMEHVSEPVSKLLADTALC